MGGLLSRWKAKPTTVEQLESLDKEIKELEEFRAKNQRLQKLWVGRLLLYSSVLYLLTSLVVYCLYLPEQWLDRLSMALPFFIYPLLVWFIRKLLIFLFSKRTERNSVPPGPTGGRAPGGGVMVIAAGVPIGIGLIATPLSFRCAYCYFLNPARKTRPQAPRLPEFSYERRLRAESRSPGPRPRSGTDTEESAPPSGAKAPAPWNLVHSFQIQQSPKSPQSRPLQSPDERELEDEGATKEAASESQSEEPQQEVEEEEKVVQEEEEAESGQSQSAPPESESRPS
ncbi:endoplasmic reticulum junction formation protein lunapark-B-like [Plectropomus leopardus]|uniref:endoplasmic reticulum junction formation protein lunapark-B-like n=1 Tax=Plectropomus leopardus TaxID=160734 RepID=UPI001C4DCC95|nr:endoplasmic reticulum junction formation protein lunapark-B-like [Plectropomus leopardus]